MTIQEKAVEYHKSGFNCAQSVLCACGEYTGLDEKTALAISAGFGGGLRCGEVCGAVSGMVMAVGAAYPFTDAADAQAKEKIAALAKTICGEFMEKYGCLRCEELKGDGKRCNEYIAACAAIAERIINEKE